MMQYIQMLKCSRIPTCLLVKIKIKIRCLHLIPLATLPKTRIENQLVPKKYLKNRWDSLKHFVKPLDLVNPPIPNLNVTRVKGKEAVKAQESVYLGNQWKALQHTRNLYLPIKANSNHILTDPSNQRKGLLSRLIYKLHECQLHLKVEFVRINNILIYYFSHDNFWKHIF